MIRAARLEVHLEALAKQRLGAGEIAVQSQHRREIAQADGGLAVLVAERLTADAEGFALNRLGALVEPWSWYTRPSSTSVTATSGFSGRAAAAHGQRLFERARRCA
jgi:hypothetical protein